LLNKPNAVALPLSSGCTALLYVATSSVSLIGGLKGGTYPYPVLAFGFASLIVLSMGLKPGGVAEGGGLAVRKLDDA
jgi:hypothetical protein